MQPLATPAAWYIRLIRKFKPEVRPIAYYKQRLMVIWIASIILTSYFIAVCGIIYYWSILTNTLEMKWWVISEAAILLVIFVCVQAGSIDEEFVVADYGLLSPSGFRSLVFLVLATFLFVTLLSLPVYLTGGAISSPFSSTIVAMSGLAVLVSSSWYIRGAIVLACMGAYLFCMFNSLDVHINSVNGHKLLHILSVLVSLGITLFLSWKGEFSIFKKGEKSNGLSGQARVVANPEIQS